MQSEDQSFAGRTLPTVPSSLPRTKQARCQEIKNLRTMDVVWYNLDFEAACSRGYTEDPHRVLRSALRGHTRCRHSDLRPSHRTDWASFS